ncbi:NAD-dependent epimerase/dehydratase family protein [Candidatus Leptofilum sp.]|uniref:NAD-dependent epimerase/dehydratase family protein n=1 Tax=Candidatus Leptofilum sp. TaxID=3241576 RepID=UPI003B5CEAC4
MKLLVIGGTRFLGRAIVDAALTKGYEITLFNRGQSNPSLYSGQVETLVGDRDGGLAVLNGRSWDAVIDTCGYVPRLVRDSATLLADAVKQYVFISSISVYPFESMREPGLAEDTAVGTMKDETVEEVNGETYGPLKALCERAAEAAMPGRVLNVRAGLIVGPHDQSDRFTYWPHRVAQGGELLVPDSPDYPTQFIDVRDLALWILHMIEQQKCGDYNVTGQAGAVTLGDVLTTSRDISGSDATFTWVDEPFLTEHEVSTWTDLPLWVGSELPGFNLVNCDKAFADGLAIRPLAETIRDTLTWQATRPTDHEWRAGLKREQEAELLQKWHNRTSE